jgi:outer membrane protein OmpA-like peptidoglycan-associated protein/tetratricopeptide (TPR) repeat protein
MNITKITLVLITFLLVTNISTAQKLSITDEKFNEHKEAGDKYYEDEEFFLAAQEYHKAEKLKPTDHYILWRLAESYRLFQDYDDAEIWYEKLGAHPDHNYPLAQFWLGLMEKVQGKYIEAEATLSSFSKNFQPKTEEDRIKLKEADFEYKGCIYALEQLKKPLRDHSVTLLPPPVNSKSIDYAPLVFFHDTSIVITSSRADAKGAELNLATGEARSDNFRFEKSGGKWVRHHNDDNFDIVNTSKDDGAGELTRDKNKYYYTICDPECAIYVSKKVNGKFTKSIKLNKNINANGYWNAQPTLSPTADTMFFVSKRPGGKGQHDLWMSVNKDKAGTTEDWGPALNLVNINTPYIEISPFWDDHTNTIYFASNGHVGFGGWDIYVAKGSKRDSIVNLGLPFNSSRDDFYFFLGQEKGYFVSNREGGIGKDDIYTFDIKMKESQVGNIPKDSFADAQSVASVGRIILGDSQQPIADLPVYLKDENGEIIKEARTNSNGEFRFENLPPDKNFKITINESDPRIKTQIDYQVEKRADVAAIAPSSTSSLPANSSDGTGEYSGSGKVINKTTQKPAPNVPVTISNESGAVVKTVKTNANGQFFVAGLPAATSYSAKLSTPNPALSLNAKFKTESGQELKPASTEQTTVAATESKNIEPINSSTSSESSLSTNTASVSTSESADKEPKTVATKKESSSFENASFASSQDNAPGSNKPKVVVDQFKIKSSNRKPSKAFFENIYFDFNAVEIGSPAKKAMDKLVEYYGNNKDIQIEIKAFSDGFGKPEYNKQLANQRGQACFDYLISRGVEQTALLLLPLGEGSPVANNNSFAGRQLNRRVEFSVVGAKAPYEPEAMAYVIEPKMTIFSIAKKFGMTQAELKDWNGGIDPADLKAYSTIRVKRTANAANIAPQSIDYVKSGTQEYKFVNMQFVPVESSSSNFVASNGNEGDFYTVQPQETLYSIAKRNGLSVDQLLQLNGMTDNNIKVGQKLRIK